ncbi:MAG: retroviral-like aspartic protease family protein [Opitutaceae bacterium]|jgi:predicted aspartyl protease
MLKIGVFGIAKKFRRDFDVMIDTGFTGFLMLPMIQALPLALTLWTTTNYTLADGSKQTKLLAFGTVVVGDDEVPGGIVLEPNSTEALLGMEFLKSYQRILVVSSKFGVGLIEEDFLEKAIAAQHAKEEKPPEGGTPITGSS